MPEEQLLYTEQHEDLFFSGTFNFSRSKSNFVSNMHIGRSRNDMGVTMYRMSLRRYVLRLMEHHLLLQESILQLAADHKETIMPAYTHTQPAQPTTFGHYTLAIYDTMQRFRTHEKTYKLLNQSQWEPLR